MTSATHAVTLEAMDILALLFSKQPLHPMAQASLLLTINGIIMQLDEEAKPAVLSVMLNAFKSHPSGQPIIDTIRVVEKAAEEEAQIIIAESHRARKN